MWIEISFWISLSVLVLLTFSLQVVSGSLGLYLMHEQTGGAWISVLERPLRKITFWFWVPPLLLIPYFLFLRTPLYSDVVHPVYFSWWFNLLRGLIYSGFLFLSVFVIRSSRATLWWKGFALAGLFLSMSGFANDTFMALDSHWKSSIFGPLFSIGCVLTALSVSVLWTKGGERSLESHRRDVGHLIMVFLLLWLYFHFSQYLIIWSAQIPHEEIWYHRIGHGWIGVYAIALILIQFAFPFGALLFRRINGSATGLWWIAASVLLGRVMDVGLWLWAGGLF